MSGVRPTRDATTGDVRPAARYAGRLSGLRTRASPPVGALEGVQGDLVGRQEPDVDEVGGTDERVAETGSAGTGDGVAQPDGPVILDEDERSGGVVRDVVDDVPLVGVGQQGR